LGESCRCSGGCTCGWSGKCDSECDGPAEVATLQNGLGVKLDESSSSSLLLCLGSGGGGRVLGDMGWSTGNDDFFLARAWPPPPPPFECPFPFPFPVPVPFVFVFAWLTDTERRRRVVGLVGVKFDEVDVAWEAEGSSWDVPERGRMATRGR
jgi:hypothetical protein